MMMPEGNSKFHPTWSSISAAAAEGEIGTNLKLLLLVVLPNEAQEFAKLLGIPLYCCNVTSDFDWQMWIPEFLKKGKLQGNACDELNLSIIY